MTTSACSTEAETVANTIRVACDTLGDVTFAARFRMRTLTRTELFPLEMHLPNSAAKFRKLAGFPMIFGAKNFEIFLPQSALDLPVPTYDPRLRDHLTEYGKRLLTEVPGEDPPLRSQIEGLLTASLPGNLLSSDAAAILGMRPRTLARRLQEAGTSYRAIIDDLRCDLAKTLMKDDMSLVEIAFALGYSDQAAFSTAFRRWTGFAPREYAAIHAFSKTSCNRNPLGLTELSMDSV